MVSIERREAYEGRPTSKAFRAFVCSMLGSDAEACYAQVGFGACLAKVQLEQQLPSLTEIQ